MEGSRITAAAVPRYSRCIRRDLIDLIDLIRAADWWEYKLVPILSAFYATALIAAVPVISLWAAALSLLLAIMAAAIYASAINEFADRGDDAAAGKRNRAAERPRAAAAFFAAAVAVGATFAWLWRDRTPLVSSYLATWLAFLLYSVRPFRLKKRGLAGVLCDAAGEQMFPALAAVFLAHRAAPQTATLSEAWVASVAAWSLSFGVRGILWHQLRDVDNDRASGVRTFVSRQPRTAAAIGAFVIFPLEIGAFAFMLWQIGAAAVWPMALLCVYALYAIRSMRRRQTVPVIVAPRPRSFVVLQDFYTELLPVALLIAASIRDPRDLVILGIHVTLFPRRVLGVIRQLSATALAERA